MPRPQERYFASEGVPFVEINTPNSSKLFRMDGAKRIFIDVPRAAAEIVLTSMIISKERALELASER